MNERMPVQLLKALIRKALFPAMITSGPDAGTDGNALPSLY